MAACDAPSTWLRRQAMRPFAHNNVYATHSRKDFIGSEILNCMQDPTLPDLGHARFVVDNNNNDGTSDGTVMFGAFLPNRSLFSAISGSASGTCSAYIVTKPDGEVVALGVDKEAFPADYHQVPLVVAQQMVMTLVAKAAAGLKANDMVSLKTSNPNETSPHALLGLLPVYGGMHRHGSFLVGRQPKVVAWCNKTLSEEYLGDGTTVPSDSVVWRCCNSKTDQKSDSLASQGSLWLTEGVAEGLAKAIIKSD